MIITRLVSGLGNQLLQYAVGRELSIRKNVPLRLDISFFNDQNLRSYKLDHYNIAAQVATNDDLQPFLKEKNDYRLLHEKTSFIAKVYRKLEPKIFPKYTKKYFKESTWWILELNVFKVPADVYIDGYWQHYKYFEKLNPLISEELTLKEPLADQAAVWLEKIKTDVASVAVHVRRGDYVTDSGANYLMGVLPVSYFEKALKHMQENVSDASFYFFSDDLDWVKENIKTTSNTFYIEGNVDYVDLELMRHCRHNIIANSTFSWWGAFLNRNKNKIVIAPEKWSAREDVNRNIHLQFPSWIKF